MYILRMSIVCIAIIILAILKNIHIIQLNSYNLDQQIIWYRKNYPSFIINIVLFISLILVYEFKFYFVYFVSIICLLGVLIENFPSKQKKKLVFTARIKRLIFICLILFFLFFIPLIIYKNDASVKYILYAVALSPVIIFIAFYISLPIENAFRKKFMNEAKKIIDESDELFTIGITGSFGKTSVKYYLDAILKSRYSVCKTPESFNTAMGATLTIKNDLKRIDEIFLCEMGARRVGDVKEICDIVSPRGGILTDVGAMHLDTFKNIENVRKCKFELIDSIFRNNKNSKFGRIVLVNGDNDLIREKINDYNFENGEVYTFGLKESNDFYANNFTFDDKGIKFDFVSNGEKIRFESRLLGIYNIRNLVAAIAYALLLKVDIDDIKIAVKNINPVKHRLELLAYGDNTLIIDDAYNSNPNGARNAVDTLSSFDGYTKIIITPGMVELGDRQNKENESFAEYAAGKCDYALVVSKTNKDSLEKGFRKNIANAENVLFFSKVEEAIYYARNEINGKKVILLENDLSDNY